MNTKNREYIKVKLKEPVRLGIKAHIIPEKGQWIIFKEGSKRALYKFQDKDSALSTGKEILKAGKINTLFLHKTDGSVDRMYSAN